MSKARQTQCPSCGSTFEVSKDQLEVASGAVRCGNCLNVFQADENFIDAPSDSPPVISSSSDLYETLTSEQDDVDESWALELLKELEDDPGSHEAANSNTHRPQDPQDNEATAVAELPTLATDEEDDEQEKRDELSETFQNIDSWKSNAGHDYFGDFEEGSDNSLASPDTVTGDSEAWAKKILETSEQEKDHQSPDSSSISNGSKSTEQVAKNQSSSEETEINAAHQPELSPFGIGNEVDEFVAKSGKSASPMDAKELVATISLEPVELSLDDGKRKRFLRSTAEFLLILIATLVLLAQYLTYNFHALSQNPSFRPWYARVCTVLECTLPQQSDISKIRGKNLVVRTHPDTPSALLVDIVITNHASFPQKLPLMELVFADLNGFPMAGRRFTPSEYLSGALKRLNSMPAKTPIHITLSIQDPGKEAVNYHVNFHQQGS